MAGIDEQLMVHADEQRQAESRLREEKAQALNGPAIEASKGPGTLDQQTAGARNALPTPAEEDSAGGGGNKVTSEALKQSWINILDSFGATLIYINIHVFGHSVFGEKVFCKLGEEWIPAAIKSGMKPGIMGLVAKIGFLEKIVLILADLLVLFALIGILTIIVWIGSMMNKNIFEQAWTGAQAITKIGWGAALEIYKLFN